MGLLELLVAAATPALERDSAGSTAEAPALALAGDRDPDGAMAKERGAAREQAQGKAEAAEKGRAAGAVTGTVHSAS